ncbi:hypothetical protein, partial [Nocardia mangyaensis]|uniref:hypothetical protein n=1 Tax=Nocardia mangyaensis TaxID=2213200 RepID=UPI00267541B1
MTKSIFMTVVFCGYLAFSIFHAESYHPVIFIMLALLVAFYSFLDYHKKQDFSTDFAEKIEEIEKKHDEDIKRHDAKESTLGIGQ